MSKTGKRKLRQPVTVVIELKPKDEVRVSGEILDRIPPSERTAFLIEHGYPIIVVETDQYGNTINRTPYNLENRAELPRYMLESLARSILTRMNTPEGKAAYEEWKKSQAAKERETGG